MGELGSADIFEFARFRFDRRGHCLYRLDKTGNTVLLPAGRTALEILGLLVEHAGEVVESEEIRKIVWRGKTVEDANLATQIFHLRESVGRDRIQTVSGRGYRFIGPVTRRNGDAGAAVGVGADLGQAVRRRMRCSWSDRVCTSRWRKSQLQPRCHRTVGRIGAGQCWQQRCIGIRIGSAGQSQMQGRHRLHAMRRQLRRQCRPALRR